MKIITFNVNGIRAAIGKGFFEWLEKENPDIICLQKTKAQPEQIDIISFQELGYTPFINSAVKKGYSGTAIFTKIEPKTAKINFDNHADKNLFTDNYGNILTEGRVITLEFDDFFLLTTYVPNAKNDLSRLQIRHKIWDNKLLEYISFLEQKKPVVVCGDMNVAHKEIDLANPKQNEKNAGYTPEEREGFENFIKHGLVDIFRYFYPETIKYTWWSMRMNAKEKNIGWRIDYFICSKSFMPKIKNIEILDNIQMSDHCPVKLEIIK